MLLDAALRTGADIATCRFYQEYVNKTDESAGPERGFIAEEEEILRALVIEKRITSDAWNKLYRADLFRNIRYPEGRIFEDIATTYLLAQKAKKLVYVPDFLIHYRNRENSLSNLHTMKSLIDYWIAYSERFKELSGISADYYRQTLADGIGAISRMWRWYSECSEKEKRFAESGLNEMEQFVKEHSREILSDPFYTRHVKYACYYTRIRNPVLFKLLYGMNHLYRAFSKGTYFEQ